MNIKKMTTLSMLTAVALTIFVIESYFPPLVPVSGVKMGLANVVTLLVLILYNRRYSFLVLILRIILASIFTGQAVNFLYSFAGGIACFLIMAFIGMLSSLLLTCNTIKLPSSNSDNLTPK